MTFFTTVLTIPVAALYGLALYAHIFEPTELSFALTIIIGGAVLYLHYVADDPQL